MPATTYIGETDFKQQQVTTFFTEGQGWTTTVPYRGSTTNLARFLTEIIIIGATFGGIVGLRVTEDGPYSNVDITYAQSPFGPAGQSDPIARTWSLIATMEEVSIWNLPKIQDGFFPPGIRKTTPFCVGLVERSPTDLMKLRNNIALAESDNLPGTVAGSIQEDFPDESMEALILGLQLRGEDTFQVPKYVLKKTDTVFSRTQLVASHTNVGKIHNYNDLVVAEPSLPTAILIDPLSLAAAQVQQKALNWLKMAPSVEQVSNGRYQLDQEYWGVAHFNPIIYDTVSTFNEVTYNQKKFKF